jgi:hypothetical protein
VRTWNSLPITEDVVEWDEGHYHLMIKVSGKVLWFPVLSQVVSVDFLIDNTPPIISISNFPKDALVHGQCEVNVSVEDGMIDDVFLDDIERLPAPRTDSAQISLNTAGLSEGAHEIHVIASDDFGHVQHSRVPFVVDNSPPKILSIGPAQSILLQGYVQILPAINDASSCSVSYWIDNLPVLQTESRILVLDTDKLPDGLHRVRMVAVDKFGMSGEFSTYVTIDRTAPKLILQPTLLPQGVIERSVLINDREHSVLNLFSLNHKNTIDCKVTDIYKDNVVSSLEMSFKPQWTLANIMYKTFGNSTAEWYSEKIYPHVLEWREMLQFTRFAYSWDPVLRPSWSSPARDFVTTGMRYVTINFGFMEFSSCVLGDFSSGFAIRMTLDQIQNLIASSWERTVERIPDTKASELVFEVGTVSGEYGRELTESQVADCSIREGVESKGLAGSWLKAFFRIGGPAQFPGISFISAFYFEIGATLAHWETERSDWWDLMPAWGIRVEVGP